MSDSVEDRVVRMHFDNEKFENGINTTINSLKSLENGLKLTGATKGLEEVEKASSKLTFSNISSGAETAIVGFNKMQQVGFTVLQELTRKAVDLGLTLANNVTQKLIGPMKEGFGEYQTQMGAVQTVLTNTADKGTKLEDVNKAFSTLNEYADKTIYNFSEMTRNIGTFTAAGVDLDAATNAIKGIANLAAGSGSTSQQASTAMYQLSQALAAGTVKLQDWNSVVNAGMGGQLFQKELQKTAESYGVNVDAIIKKAGSFRESLSEGWITADVLTATLNRFADESTDIGKRLTAAATEVKTVGELFDSMGESVGSGWARLWQIIIGDYDEAKQVLTEIFNAFDTVVGGMFDKINSTAEGWKKLGGRTKLIEALRDAFKTLGTIMNRISYAFKSVIPSTTAKDLADLTSNFKNFITMMKPTNAQLLMIQKSAQGFFSIFSMIGQIISKIDFTPLKNSTALFKSSFTVIGTWLTKLNRSGELVNSVSELLNKLVIGLSYVRHAFFQAFPEPSMEALRSLSDTFLKFIKSLTPTDAELLKIGKIASGVFSIFRIGIDIVSGFIKAFSKYNFIKQFISILISIGSAIGGFISTVQKAESTGNVFFKIFNTIFGVLDGIFKIIASVINGITSGFSAMNTALKETLNIDIAGFFSNFGNHLSDFGKKVLDFVKGFNLSEILNNVSDSIQHASERINSFFTGLGKNKKPIEDTSNSLNNMATSAKKAGDQVSNDNGPFGAILNIMHNVTKKVSEFVRSITGFISGLFKKFSEFTRTAEGGALRAGLNNIIKIVKSLMGLGIIGFIASISKSISNLLGKNGIGGVLGSLTETIDKFGNGFKQISKAMAGAFEAIGGVLEGYQTKLKAEALKEIAVAIAILAASLFVLSLIDVESLSAAVLAITGLFADLISSMAILVKTTGAVKSAEIMGIAKAMKSMATAILIVSIALKIVSTIDTNKLAASTSVITALIFEMVKAAESLAGIEKKSKGATKGLISLAAAVLILSISMKIISSIDKDNLAAALGVITALIFEMVKAAESLASTGGKIKGAASAFIALSVGILILSIAIKSLSKLNMESMIVSVLAISLLLLMMGEVVKNLASSSKGAVKGATSFVLISAGLMIVAMAIEKIAALGLPELIQAVATLLGFLIAMAVVAKATAKTNPGAIIGIASALTMVANAVKMIAVIELDKLSASVVALVILMGALTVCAIALGNDGKKMGASVTGFIGFGVAMIAIAAALRIMAGADSKSLIVATMALIGVMAAIALMTKLVDGKQLLMIAPAMIAMGVALIVLGAGLLLLSKIPFAGLIVSLVALAAVFVVIAVAMRFIKPVISTMLQFSAGLVLMGAGMALTAVALVIFAVALTMLATAIQPALLAILSCLQLLLDYIPDIVAIIGELITSILAELKNWIPIILDTLFAMLIGILDSLINNLPVILDKVLILLEQLFTQLTTNQRTRKLIEKTFDFLWEIILGFMDSLIKKTPALVHDVFEWVATFLESLHKELSTNGRRIAKAIADIIGDLLQLAIDAIEELFKRLTEIGYNIGTKVGEGLQEVGEWLKEKLIEPIENGLQWIKDKFGEFLTAGKNIINNIVNGIKKVKDDIINNVKDGINKAVDWITGLYDTLVECGKDFINGFIDGITSMGTSIWNNVQDVGTQVVDWWKDVLGIHSPSVIAEDTGFRWIEGFLIAFFKSKSNISKAIMRTGDNIVSTFAKSIDTIPTISSDLSMTSTITPVVDMDSAIKNINKLADITTKIPNIDWSVAFAPPDISFDADEDIALNVNNSDVVTAINKLQTKLDAMEAKIKGLTITLDGKTLVGELTPSINEEMGRLTTLQIRGV